MLLPILLVFVSGCTQPTHSTPVAQDICIQICKSSNKDLSNGPCLSDNNLEWNVNDWVCDIAHSPRQTVDNLPENQCSAFRSGQAHHFVEVDVNCNLIRAV
jgi:hypothetical protein